MLEFFGPDPDAIGKNFAEDFFAGWGEDVREEETLRILQGSRTALLEELSALTTDPEYANQRIVPLLTSKTAASVGHFVNARSVHCTRLDPDREFFKIMSKRLEHVDPVEGLGFPITYREVDRLNTAWLETFSSRSVTRGDLRVFQAFNQDIVEAGGESRTYGVFQKYIPHPTVQPSP